MTYTVSSGMLNSSIPYHTILLRVFLYIVFILGLHWLHSLYSVLGVLSISCCGLVVSACQVIGQKDASDDEISSELRMLSPQRSGRRMCYVYIVCIIVCLSCAPKWHVWNTAVAWYSPFAETAIFAQTNIMDETYCEMPYTLCVYNDPSLVNIAVMNCGLMYWGLSQLILLLLLIVMHSWLEDDCIYHFSKLVNRQTRWSDWSLQKTSSVVIDSPVQGLERAYQGTEVPG